MSDRVLADIDVALPLHDSRKFTGPCGCDPTVDVICESCFTYDALLHAKAEIERLRARHAEIVSELYGQGFEVAGWHLNGDLQPLDSWFEDTEWLDEAAEAAGGE